MTLSRMPTFPDPSRPRRPRRRTPSAPDADTFGLPALPIPTATTAPRRRGRRRRPRRLSVAGRSRRLAAVRCEHRPHGPTTARCLHGSAASSATSRASTTSSTETPTSRSRSAETGGSNPPGDPHPPRYSGYDDRIALIRIDVPLLHVHEALQPPGYTIGNAGETSPQRRKHGDIRLISGQIGGPDCRGVAVPRGGRFRW